LKDVKLPAVEELTVSDGLEVIVTEQLGVVTLEQAVPPFRLNIDTVELALSPIFFVLEISAKVSILLVALWENLFEENVFVVPVL
jgi:hypothetical protein